MITSGATMRPRTGLLLGGRYELTERIAVGGMGEVWQATDRRLGRTVAAKVLRTELVGDEQFLARLRTEARNSAGLRHVNVAMLLDHGEQEGSGYLVMELVEGETLADRLERRGTIPAAELLPVLVQACRGLHAAHTAGIIHRDVKPANLILTPDGTVKLTDFGISLGSNQAPMTSAGMVMGTAQYLPPEQAMGRAATPAGDVYALGVLAYECLVGRRPYTGTTQVDIAFAHVSQPLPPLPGSVPAEVRDVVERMLAKDPAGRPASALVCARELESAGRRNRRDARTAPPQPVPAHEPAPSPVSPARPVSGFTPVPELPGQRTPPPTRRRSGAHRAGRSDDGAGSPPSPPDPRTSVVPRSPDTGTGRTPDAGPAPGSATAPEGHARWSVPTWAELAADRVWLAAMVVVLVVLMILVVAALGSLSGADSSAAGPIPADIYPSKVKDI